MNELRGNSRSWCDRNRILSPGEPHEALPVNARCRMHNYDKDGAMRLTDNNSKGSRHVSTSLRQVASEYRVEYLLPQLALAG